MQERIIEIIIYLLEQFQHTPDKDTRKDLSEELFMRGYTENEVNLGFSWVLNHLQSKTTDPDKLNAQDASDHILNDLENFVISPEAYGYLLQLYHLGVLSEPDMEDVISRAYNMGNDQLTLDDIKAMAASLIFNPESGYDENFLFRDGSDTIH